MEAHFMACWSLLRTLQFLFAALMVLSAGCANDEPSIRRELDNLPEAWKTAPYHKDLNVVLAELAGRRCPSWFYERGVPQASASNILVLSSALPQGARLLGKLQGRNIQGCSVILKLLGEKGNAELTIWRFDAVDEYGDRLDFDITVPDSGAFAGAAFAVTGDTMNQGVIEVQSLILEERRPTNIKPNIILLTLDTFRADYLSIVNASSPSTPTLDSLAASGALFTDAIATSNCTSPSHVSIMSGLYCFAHQVYGNSHGLSSAATSIAEALKSEGYKTLGAVSIQHLNPEVSNLGEGFDSFLPSRYPYNEPADIRTAEILRNLQLVHFDGSPWFLWAHFFDPHTPYTPPPSFADRFPTDFPPKPIRYEGGMGAVKHDEKTKLLLDPGGEITRYRGEIAFLDQQIGVLLAGIRTLGLLRNSVVMVVGDHGEGLGEHEFLFQHAAMYHEVLRVPMILSGSRIPRGKRAEERVSTVDIFPTLLGLAGAESVPPCHGLDLLPTVKGERKNRDRAILSESVGNWAKTVWQGNLRYLWVPSSKPKYWKMYERHNLFDLAADPDETRNIFAGNEADAAKLKAEWEALVSHSPVTYQRFSGKPDEERLKALGYIQ